MYSYYTDYIRVRVLFCFVWTRIRGFGRCRYAYLLEPCTRTVLELDCESGVATECTLSSDSDRSSPVRLCGAHALNELNMRMKTQTNDDPPIPARGRVSCQFETTTPIHNHN